MRAIFDASEDLQAMTTTMTTMANTTTTTMAAEAAAHHPSAEEFLMITVHYSWICLLLLVLLAGASYCAHKKHGRRSTRTSQTGGSIAVHHTPGLLAHGAYPFAVRGTISTLCFMLGVLPLFLMLCATIIGLLLAVVEGWPASLGVEYLLSNVLGMTAPLTSIVPEGRFGIHFAIVMNMYAVIMVTTAMGLIANMSLMAHITEKVPRSMCGFLAFLLIAVPLAMIATTWLVGLIMAAFEGWDAEQGYFFMAASMASLANPVTSLEPDTALGAFFECLCMATELCIAGCILGMVAAHPVTMSMCDILEGTARHGASMSALHFNMPNLTVEELQVRLQALRGEAEVRAPDDKELLEQLAEVEADLKAGKDLTMVAVHMSELHEKIQSASQRSGDPSAELEVAQLRARVAELEKMLGQEELEIRTL
ncbi:unnamed protein product [Effrenium voratum]|uniref:Uncharacterized protein n=1 Tax=Effrenium voratum TaxID=2562239 RepID=A0AA36HM54_9DINO|nr:unnamed protein product [Effrenium voratum]